MLSKLKLRHFIPTGRIFNSGVMIISMRLAEVMSGTNDLSNVTTGGKMNFAEAS